MSRSADFGHYLDTHPEDPCGHGYGHNRAMLNRATRGFELQDSEEEEDDDLEDEEDEDEDEDEDEEDGDDQDDDE